MTPAALISKAVDIVLPPRCLVTGQTVEKPGMIAPDGWASLDFLTPPICGCCGFPFEFTVPGDPLCLSCLSRPPAFDQARSAVRYNDTSRDLVLSFKHGDKLHTATSFVPWLRRTGAEMLEAADVLIPVPLHPFRLIARRYNQAAILALGLGKETGIPVMTDGLKRIRATPSQGKLRRAEREKNVRSAFAVNPARAAGLTGKRVVLIDDVYTTGSTVNECAKTLKKEGGADWVGVLAVARVLRNS